MQSVESQRLSSLTLVLEASGYVNLDCRVQPQAILELVECVQKSNYGSVLELALLALAGHALHHAQGLNAEEPVWAIGHWASMHPYW